VFLGRQPQRSIVLTGFYGCGALDIGRELSRRMRRLMIDWDAELSRRSKRELKLPLPFAPPASSGTTEQRLMAELPFKREAIIVLGPEAVELEGWPSAFNESCFTVFVDPPFEALWKRLRSDPDYEDYCKQYSLDEAAVRWRELMPLYQHCILRLNCSPNPARQARVVMHAYYT
jgi:shikimate kinase